MNAAALETLVALAGDAVHEHAPFGARTTYRVGGTARVLVDVASLDDLHRYSPALRALASPTVVLGNGSNLLVADGEFDGAVLVLGDGFSTLDWRRDGDGVVAELGAAMDLPVAARRLADAGVTGFEWAVGVPGTLGGAAVMNAGGHGSDMAHCVRTVTTWNIQRDRVEQWSLSRLGYGYRVSALGPNDVVVAVSLSLQVGDATSAKATIRDIVRWRREHQPGGANAGSVFRNPPDGFAGALIEAAGCKGRSFGTAQVSEKHANFIQVSEHGRASDVRALMNEVRDAVAADSGVVLESELRALGFEERP